MYFYSIYVVQGNVVFAWYLKKKIHNTSNRRWRKEFSILPAIYIFNETETLDGFVT